MAILRLAILVFMLFISFQGYAEEKKATPNDRPNDKKVWLDVKKDVPQVKANIPEEYNDLIKVFEKYWTAFKSKKYEEMYHLEVADFKERVPFEKYKAMKGSGSAELKVISVRPVQVKKIDEKEVIVEAAFAYNIGFADSVKLFNDRWIITRDGWKHIPSKKEVMEPGK